jgi:tol-pal system protein YbgF
MEIPTLSLTALKPGRRLGLTALLVASLAAPAAAAPLFGQQQPSAPPVVHVAQNQQQAAQLAVRIQQLEEQLRTLTGQVEGLQFQLTQMQTLLEKQTADNEFRFQQLEGGAPPGKPQAATDAGGATPAGGLPQTQGSETQAPIATGEPPVAGDVPTLPADEMPMDSVGDSQDPLVGTNGADGDLANLGAGRPLDLSLDGGTPSNGDANAQYQAGYDAIVRGDYAFAEEQFKQFIALYPDDPQAADATNWLGEALIQRGAFDEAADVLLTGFQKYTNAQRAPDILLKLGVALAGAGETDTACRTFAEVQKRYSGLSAAFSTRLADEKAKAQCPA